MRSSTRALLTYHGLHSMILISYFLKLSNANRFWPRSRSLCSPPLNILGFHSRINLKKYMVCSYYDNCHDLVCVATLLYPEDAISLKSSASSCSCILYTSSSTIIPAPWMEEYHLCVSCRSDHSEPLMQMSFEYYNK